MAKVKNATDRPIAAYVEGEWYNIGAGKGASVEPRTALLLGEYGLTVEDHAEVVKAEADDVPETDGETNHTGGRQHRMDDERTNVAGTPVTVTGDTGSTTPEAGVQGVTAAEAAAGEPNEVRGAEGDPSLTEEQLDVLTTPDPVETVQVDGIAAAPADPEGAVVVQDTDVVADPYAWVDQLKGRDLEDYLATNGLVLNGTADERRARVREFVSAAPATPAPVAPVE